METETDRDGQRQTEIETETDRDGQRQSEMETETDRDGQRQGMGRTGDRNRQRRTEAE